MMTDFYELLGVARSATQEEIATAYRKLAIKYHPDHNQRTDAAATFARISSAYTTLYDPSKRATYDLRHKVAPPAPPPKPKDAPKTKEDFEAEREREDRLKRMLFTTYTLEPDWIQCQFTSETSTHGRGLMMQVPCTPQEMKTGGTKIVTVKRRTFCGRCGGDGKGSFTCPRCNNNAHQRMVCGYCHTKGYMDSKCQNCNGGGLYGWELSEVAFKIPPNSQIGNIVTIVGVGEAGRNKIPGSGRFVLVGA